jgi:urease accessory protein
MHGLAHGAETPASGFVAYAAGFLATTATLHFGGVLAGLSLRKYLTGKAIRVTQFLGLLCGGAGVYLFSRL